MKGEDFARVHFRVETDTKVHHGEAVVRVEDQTDVRAALEVAAVEVMEDVLDRAAPRLGRQAEWEQSRHREALDEHRSNR